MDAIAQYHQDKINGYAVIEFLGDSLPKENMVGRIEGYFQDNEPTGFLRKSYQNDKYRFGFQVM